MISTPYYTAPRLHDRVCQNIRQRFDDNLTWLECSFPIAYLGVIESKDEELSYPRIYANDGSTTHYDVRPDDSVRAFCFFELDDTLAIDEWDGTEYTFSVIFYARLDKAIPGDSAQDYTAKLIAQVVGQLKHISIDARVLGWDTNPENIFDKYTGLEEIVTQSQMKLGTAFKITFTVWDGEDCYT